MSYFQLGAGMALKYAIFTLITFRYLTTALDCVSKDNLSSCSPGKKIRFVEGNNSGDSRFCSLITATVQSTTFLPQPFLYLPGKCGDVFACEGSDIDIRTVQQVNLKNLISIIFMNASTTTAHNQMQLLFALQNTQILQMKMLYHLK